ncbi:MAG: ribosomal protein S18-alanine N-acetyltransferase [Elusimicrobia bacterium]|nr:ribosomal protein S18-alanine N-acetyltransferase [Candidatus Liberimonas magnetica]
MNGALNLEFLPLKREYISEILEIEKVSFPEPWTREMFERELSLPLSRFFVLKFENKIAGYAAGWLILDEAHITNIAVHPDYRNKGLGSKALEFLVEDMCIKGARKALLEVRESNTVAQKLYKSAGFKAVGFREKYYRNEGAILMEKNL